VLGAQLTGQRDLPRGVRTGHGGGLGEPRVGAGEPRVLGDTGGVGRGDQLELVGLQPADRAVYLRDVGSPSSTP
jgi:hypothetical protein